MDNPVRMERFLASVERRAYRMAVSATGSRDEALDLVQESMLGLVKRYADRPETEWRPLFYRILQSRIRDWYRRRRIRTRWRVFLGRGPGVSEKEGGGDPLDRLPDPAETDPAERVLQKDRAAAVKEALASLPLRQQQAFLLRAWEELSVRETATAMKCSEGSVKTHYARAIQALRERLGSEGP